MPLRQIRQIGVVAVLLLIAASGLALSCASTSHARSGVQRSVPRIERAGVVPENWERVEVLRPGAFIAITLKTGARRAGTFKRLDPMMLTIIDRGGHELCVARPHVATIVLNGAKDPVASGALAGGGVGAAAALVILAIIGSGDGHVLPSAKWGAPLLLSGAGATIGAIVDRAHNSQELLYRAASSEPIKP